MPQTMTQEPRMVPTSRALANTLSRAAAYARQQGHRLVCLEHVLLSLTEDEDAVAVLASSSVDLARLRHDVAAHIGRIEDRAHPQDTAAPGIHGDVKRILEYAAAAAQQSRRTNINGAIVLAAIVGEGHSMAASLLRAQGLTFEVAIHALQRAFAAGSRPPQQVAGPESYGSPPAAAPTPPPPSEVQAPSSRVTDAILAGARERVRASRMAATEGGSPQVGAGPSGVVPRQPTPAPPEPVPSPPDLTYDRHEPATEAVAPAVADDPVPPSLDLPPRLGPDPAAGASPSANGMPAPELPGMDRRRGPAASAPPQEAPPMLPAGGPITYDGEPRLPAPAADGHPAAPPRPPHLPAPGGAISPGPAGRGPRYVPPPPPARDPPHPDWRPPPSPGPLRFEDGRQQPVAGPAPSYGVPVPAPWPEAALPGTAATEPTALPVDGNFAGAPYPVPDDGTGRDGKPGAGGEIAPGQLLDNIPRTMRVGRPETVEVRIARASFETLAQGMPGRSLTFRHDIAVMRAMAVRLKSVDGMFWIEAMSPETQWVENRPGLIYDDFASWRWSVTPRRRGRGDLQLVIACRTVGDDGVAADTSLPEHAFNIRVRPDYASAARLWAGRLGAMATGAIIAKLSDGTIMDGLRALRGMLGI